MEIRTTETFRATQAGDPQYLPLLMGNCHSKQAEHEEQYVRPQHHNRKKSCWCSMDITPRCVLMCDQFGAVLYFVLYIILRKLGWECDRKAKQ